MNWTYRKKITIAGSIGAGTGYQVLLKVGESSGALGYNFHVEGKADNFPDDKGRSGDLLFTADDGTTLLPFWTESISGTSPNRVANIWVKVAVNLDTDQDIYCYYGNPDSLNICNGENTFDLFDDFVSLGYDDLWTKEGSGILNKGYGTLFTAGNGGQGLTTDGTYFYFGKTNGSGVDGIIYKYDFSGNLQTSFDGPPHAAGGSYRIDNDTILFSTGGIDTPEVWELSKIGTKLRSWDFTGEGYNRGTLIAYKDVDRIYLFTSDTSYNFKIQEYQINDNGTWSIVGIEYSHTSLGVPQGLTFYDGYLYYLFDNGISKLQLDAGGMITILETLSGLPGAEKEGLTHWGDIFYYGDSNLDVRIIYNEWIVDISANTTFLTSKESFGKNTAIKLHCRTSSNSLDYPMWGYRSSDGQEYAAIGKLHVANNYLQTRTKTGGNQTESGNIYASQQTWTHYEIARGDSTVKYYVAGDLKYTETNNVPTGDITIKLGGITHSESGNFRTSWVLIRNYIDIEPSFSSASIEEYIASFFLNCPPFEKNSTLSLNSFLFIILNNFFQKNSYLFPCDLFLLIKLKSLVHQTQLNISFQKRVEFPSFIKESDLYLYNIVEVPENTEVVSSWPFTSNKKINKIDITPILSVQFYHSSKLAVPSIIAAGVLTLSDISFQKEDHIITDMMVEVVFPPLIKVSQGLDVFSIISMPVGDLFLATVPFIAGKWVSVQLQRNVVYQSFITEHEIFVNVFSGIIVDVQPFQSVHSFTGITHIVSILKEFIAVKEINMNLQIVLFVSPFISGKQINSDTIYSGNFVDCNPFIHTQKLALNINNYLALPTLIPNHILKVPGVYTSTLSPSFNHLSELSVKDILVFAVNLAEIYYFFTLTGQENGLSDVEIPISSFQASIRNGTPSYLQVVIPGIDYADAISDRPDGTMKVYMGYKLFGEIVKKQVFVEADLETIRLDKGVKNIAITLTGHKTETYTSKDIIIKDVIYESITGPKYKFRFAEPIIDIHPGDNITVGNVTFIADLIVYYVKITKSGIVKTMEVSQ